MISTKPKEEVSKAEELFRQYVKLEHVDRNSFMEKVTKWLVAKVEASNKLIAEQEKSK